VALIQQNLRLRATARILAKVPQTFIEKWWSLGRLRKLHFLNDQLFAWWEQSILMPYMGKDKPQLFAQMHGLCRK
jgi:hypothetical protein